MKIIELQHMIRDYGIHNGDWDSVNGYELLEHIEDIPGFVSLLCKFKLGVRSFTGDHPDTIEFILNHTVIFSIQKQIGGGYHCTVDDDYNYCTYFYYETEGDNPFHENQ